MEMKKEIAICSAVARRIEEAPHQPPKDFAKDRQTVYAGHEHNFSLQIKIDICTRYTEGSTIIRNENPNIES